MVLTCHMTSRIWRGSASQEICFVFPLESDKWLKATVDFQWTGYEVLIIFPSVDVRRHAVSLRKMGGEKCPRHTGRFSKIIFMIRNCSYHMQLKPRPLGLVTWSSWWPHFSAAQPEPTLSHQQLKLLPTVTSTQSSFIQLERMTGGRRNTR